MTESIDHLRERDVLTVVVLVLLGVGCLMVHSAAVDVAGDTRLLDWGVTATRHALYAALALLTFCVASRLDYRLLQRPAVAWGVGGFAVLLCAAVLVPGIGTDVNGARRWLRFGPLTLQPSEVLKWATVAFLAWRLSRPGGIRLWRGFGFLPTCGVVGVGLLLVVVEDFGTAALIGAVVACMMLAGPVRLRWLAAAGVPGLLGAFWFVWTEPYRWRRIMSFLDPWADPERDGYHVIQSLYAFAGGGWTGRGLGHGVQKLGYLPEDTTDFIFAIVCEELGLFGALTLAVAYGTLLWVGWRVARDAHDPLGRMLAYGVTVTVGLQAAINVAVATASVPTKGIALPLVSAGGSGLVCTAFMLGLVYSVSRGGRLEERPDGSWERLVRGDVAAADNAGSVDDAVPDALRTSP